MIDDMGWSRRIRASIAVGLAGIGVVLVCTGLATSAPRDPPLLDEPNLQSSPSTTAGAPEAERPRKPSEGADVRDTITGSVLPESDPVLLSIPKIGVRSALIDLGLDSKGAMEVPRDPADPGWFSRGAAPGALGPAVVAGHVTWNGEPGVFYRLGKLRPGDPVEITREDGRTATFVVSRLARYSKERFPTRTVYGAIDHAGLRLITCGGSYDSSRSRYPDNVVVYARLESVRAPKR